MKIGTSGEGASDVEQRLLNATEMKADLEMLQQGMWRCYVSTDTSIIIDSLYNFYTKIKGIITIVNGKYL